MKKCDEKPFEDFSSTNVAPYSLLLYICRNMALNPSIRRLMKPEKIPVLLRKIEEIANCSRLIIGGIILYEMKFIFHRQQNVFSSHLI